MSSRRRQQTGLAVGSMPRQLHHLVLALFCTVLGCATPSHREPAPTALPSPELDAGVPCAHYLAPRRTSCSVMRSWDRRHSGDVSFGLATEEESVGCDELVTVCGREERCVCAGPLHIKADWARDGADPLPPRCEVRMQPPYSGLCLVEVQDFEAHPSGACDTVATDGGPDVEAQCGPRGHRPRTFLIEFGHAVEVCGVRLTCLVK